jgi:hypothetical protein
LLELLKLTEEFILPQGTMERRGLERLVIPYAEVYYKPVEFAQLFIRASGPVPLLNLNKSGACIEVRQELEIRRRFHLRIKIAGERVLKVKGLVRWCLSDDDHNHLRAGVQFLPYGDGSLYNPTHTLDRLRRLEEQFRSLLNKSNPPDLTE